jgi:hypothetical protein
MPSKRTKALSVEPEVRQRVMERDEGRCIMCNRNSGLTIAHFLNRGAGGLGIEENLVVLCLQCHFNTDQTIKRKINLGFIKNYLISKYPEWDERKLKYGYDNRVKRKD